MMGEELTAGNHGSTNNRPENLQKKNKKKPTQNAEKAENEREKEAQEARISGNTTRNPSAQTCQALNKSLQEQACTSAPSCQWKRLEHAQSTVIFGRKNPNQINSLLSFCAALIPLFLEYSFKFPFRYVHES